MSNTLGEFLRELRGKESLRSVSERIDGRLSHSYISDLEKGTSRRGTVINPTPEALKILSEAYNVNYDKLMSLAGYIEEKDSPSLSNKQMTVAAHIDDDVSDEQMEDILNYIDFIKQKHSKKDWWSMDKAEQLMSTFADIDYVFDNRMPSGQKGLYIDNSIYLNPQQSSCELTSTVAEEIAHHYTSVGDITNYELTEARKQERKARLVAAEITIHPTQLILAYENGCREYWEVADELEITVEALKEGIELFKEKYGEGFIYGGFKIVFGSGDSMKVVKIK